MLKILKSAIARALGYFAFAAILIGMFWFKMDPDIYHNVIALLVILAGISFIALGGVFNQSALENVFGKSRTKKKSNNVIRNNKKSRAP